MNHDKLKQFAEAANKANKEFADFAKVVCEVMGTPEPTAYQIGMMLHMHHLANNGKALKVAWDKTEADVLGDIEEVKKRINGAFVLDEEFLHTPTRRSKSEIQRMFNETIMNRLGENAKRILIVDDHMSQISWDEMMAIERRAMQIPPVEELSNGEPDEKTGFVKGRNAGTNSKRFFQQPEAHKRRKKR